MTDEPVNFGDWKKKKEEKKEEPKEPQNTTYRIWIRKDVVTPPGFTKDYYEATGKVGIGAFTSVLQGETNVQFLMPTEFLLFIEPVNDNKLEA